MRPFQAIIILFAQTSLVLTMLLGYAAVLLLLLAADLTTPLTAVYGAALGAVFVVAVNVVMACAAWRFLAQVTGAGPALKPCQERGMRLGHEDAVQRLHTRAEEDL